ncbi:cellulose binding domain-containing protein [Wenjunlia tyrosinilytica]|uniref:chitinase n=1 Tax=Wenjunlia tyrosinilytica TaxID=1544741 RepID=A0A917ZPH5_9ACTN|nr:cellulose binding domain-containing protein [Wenjunlia tyrosinilytica]GGO88829.1 sugar hydrolase [Wenjunlia tyrosinilytica]
MSTHRKSISRRAKAIGVVTATSVVAAGAAVLLSGTASAASLGAAYTRTSDWSGGYTAQYVVTNNSDKPLSDWKLEFDLPQGTELGTLWNAKSTVSGQHVSVTAEEWTKSIAAHKSVSIGFVTKAAAKGADPVNCRIDGEKCSVDDSPVPEPSGRPTATPTATPTTKPTPTPTKPTPTPTQTKPPTPTPTPTPSPTGGGGSAAFAPYVDTSLFPPFDLLAAAKATGVKEFNLAFITSGGGCTPKWGGVTELGSDAVAARIGDLRKSGGDVRVSFGGAVGSELGTVCGSPSELADAYGKVIDQFKLTKVDFDIEGGALANKAANSRRARAIAELQKDHPDLEVSFTLPVLPSGLTQDGVDLVADAKKNGVDTSAVNIMAMDYGTSFDGDMGQLAIDAATATHGQIKGVLGLSDAAAWKAVAVTPMIGVNDVSSEIFKVDDADQLVTFAKSKNLAWLSMWSSTRDKECDGGPQNSAQATCSSISQSRLAFTKAFGAYTD